MFGDSSSPRGGRPNLFTFTMMGMLDTVRAMIDVDFRAIQRE
jgi:hypothetical protein